jgi:hypothetical protein
MPVTTKKMSIGADRWELNILPAIPALRALGTLSDIMGVGIKAFMENGGRDALIPKSGNETIKASAEAPETLLEKDVDVAVIARATAAVLSRLQHQETIDFLLLLLEGLRKNDREVDFNTEFAANYGTLTRVVGWALKENFGSFLEGKLANVMNGQVKRVMNSVT